MIPEEFLLDSYRYHLPQEHIAQSPAKNRDASRLLVLNRKTGETASAKFADIAAHIPENALLVANNTKVLPARVYGSKDSGGRVEFLLLTPLPLIQPQGPDAEGLYWADVQGLLRASKAPKKGSTVTFGHGFSLQVQERGEFGQSKVRLRWQGELAEKFRRLGHYPLPPYIKRPDTPEDALRYQTVYANEHKLGSVAAPTAGLHFTPEVRKSLSERNAKWAEITLYVGYGTFSPVRQQDIRKHVMHREYIEIPEATSRAVAQAKAESRPVVAVGTTSVRALEGAYAACGDIAPFAGWTDIFIKPGYVFKTVDKIITNFHLPESSLLIMVSAFADRGKILNAYSKALFEGFRFFSYGDAMLIT